MVFAFSMMSAFFAGLLLLTVPDLSVFGRPVFLLIREAAQKQFSVEQNTLSYNVSTCPGACQRVFYRRASSNSVKATNCAPSKRQETASLPVSASLAPRATRTAWTSQT